MCTLHWCVCVQSVGVCVPAFLFNFHSPNNSHTPTPLSLSLPRHPLTCLPSLLTLFPLLSIQLGITGLHIIFCSTSESRLFKISVIFLSLCLSYGFVCTSAERLCLLLHLGNMHCIKILYVKSLTNDQKHGRIHAKMDFTKLKKTNNRCSKSLFLHT